MDEDLRITVEDVREQNAKILQLIDLPTLLPLLREKGILTEAIIKKVSDSKHYGQFERSNFLLNFLYQNGQKAIDAFVVCLRHESGQTAGHAEILRLLEGDLFDTPQRSPLFEILDLQLDVIEKRVKLMSLLNALLKTGAIQVRSFMDLQSTDRTLEENLAKLFSVLEKQGTRGFINFLSCLKKDVQSPEHEKLFELLLLEVKKFFKEHPQRDMISHSDRIEILQLERREKVIGQEIHQRVTKHRARLVAQLNMPALLPSLYKHQIVSRQEMDYLSKLDQVTQNKEFVDLLLNKEIGLMAKFVECVRDSPPNKDLEPLLSLSAVSVPMVTPSEVERIEKVPDKFDKLAVFVCAQFYLSPNSIPSSLEPQAFDQPIREHRETLQRQLESTGFNVLTLQTSIDDEDGVEFGRAPGEYKGKFINKKFKENIASHCNEGAVVFVFVSGMQFPCKTHDHQTREDNYSGAVLRTNASKYGRLPLDSIECEDLAMWVGELPKAHVTFLIDTDPSHIAAYDRQQHVSRVEIMQDPWKELTSLDSNTVVFFLRPDPDRMAASGGRDQETPLGMLTETFSKAFVSCFLKNKEEVSHRSFYEAVSFYWHSCDKGRRHQLFLPAVRGDMDRCFLGKSSTPYQQIYRADLKRTEPSGSDKEGKEDNNSKEIFSREIKIPTGTMAGLIQGDQLEIFHVLRPDVRVAGRVTVSYQLYSVAAVDEGEGWTNLCRVLNDLYQSGDLKGKGSFLEFLFVRKRFPLYQRVAVYPQELSRSDTASLKDYIKDRSLLLSNVTNKQEADVVVSHDGQRFLVEDLKRDVKYNSTTISVQRVKSMLEIIAWYKYVKSLKSRNKTTASHECSLTAGRALLSPAAPLCRGFDIEWSSWVGIHPTSIGYEAILNFSDPPMFWTPTATDKSPRLTVHFKKNRIITAVELRSDPTHVKYVKNAKVVYQSIVSEKKVVIDVSKKNNNLDFESREAVQFVSIKPNVAEHTPFTLAMRFKTRRMQGAKPIIGDVQVVVVQDWNRAQEFGWTFTPPFNQGYIQLDHSNYQLTWTGGNDKEILFDLGLPGVLLERIEFLDTSNPTCLKEFDVCVKTLWMEISLDPFETAWTKKCILPRPIIASDISILELQVSPSPNMGTPPLSIDLAASDIKLQLQLYGNIHGEPLNLDEDGMMTFQLNSFIDRPLYVYILCLEETGEIIIVNEGDEKAPEPSEDALEKKRYPPFKQLLETYIPKDYCPTSGSIRDVYRVWVSHTKLYMEPFCQRGVHRYHETSCYNVCTQGHRSREVIDEWYDHQFEVNIKKVGNK